MFQSIKDVFKSQIKSQEILFVLENVKPVARIMQTNEELQAIKIFCDKHKLHIEEANFKIAMLDPNKKFSNKGLRVPKNSPLPSYEILYISKEEKKAKIAKEFEQDNDHMGLGVILGYPECCCRFFAEHFGKESKDNLDFIRSIAKNSISQYNPYQTNILATPFDKALISHFPHSFDCDKTKDLADKYAEVLEKYNILNIASLKCLAIYTPESTNLLYGTRENNHFIVKDILSTSKDDFYNMLYNVKKIEIVDKHCIRLHKETLRNPYMVVISFDKY